jgi:DMSO/TMAO reductase YedYZ molybdopterin-dependent catalytic subunit
MQYKLILIVSVIALVLQQCSHISAVDTSESIDTAAQSDSTILWHRIENQYPDFFTKTEDYFITRIGSIPAINANSYRLTIRGLIDRPSSLSLAALYALPQTESPVTIECIGNPISGRSMANAYWKGFSIFNLITSLGLSSAATGVRYTAADGYYVTHTLDQLKSNNIIGALFLNGDTLPPVQGFPLRIINPGFYGAKQPAWVTDIEVIGMPVADYWDDRGWDTSPRMPVDSRIFFPLQNDTFTVGDTVEIGGAAFGGTRIASVEISTNQRVSWQKARIIRSIDADNVWKFWYASLTFADTGWQYIYARSTDILGNTQPETDTISRDGMNAQPFVRIKIK